MKPRFAISASAFLISAALAVPLFSQGGPIGPETAQNLKAFLDAAVTRGDARGVVVMITSPSTTLFHYATGYRDWEQRSALTPDAIFRVASMVKPVTSLAALTLVDEGKLELDKPVEAYLPGFKTPPVIESMNPDGTFTTRAASSPITIRHLLTHTSGYAYGWSDPRIAAIRSATQIDELAVPLVHDPGTRWTYGPSTRLLGNVLAEVSKSTLDNVLRERVFDPLAMPDATFSVSPDQRSRVTTINRRIGGELAGQPNPASLPVNVQGDGGLYATAADYAAFMRFGLRGTTADGKRLLSLAMFTAFTSNQLGSAVITTQPAANRGLTAPFPDGGGRDGWSFGFQVTASAKPGSRSLGSLGWAGLNNTHFWIDPARQIGVVVLMQVLPFYDDKAMEIVHGVEAIVSR